MLFRWRMVGGLYLSIAIRIYINGFLNVTVNNVTVLVTELITVLDKSRACMRQVERS